MAILKSNPYMFADLNWKDVALIKERGRTILLLPLGSTESHGPHCPLSTDTVISLETCLRSADRLKERSYDVFVLPPLSYTVAEYARRFPGTISIAPEIVTSLIAGVCLSLIKQGFHRICIFNSHFEPAHLKCIYDALQKIERESGTRVLFTDITKKKYSSRLTPSFQKGETHADRYETSIVMAVDPSLVNDVRRRSLPYLPINLVKKIFEDHLNEFNQFGMSESYCGNPAVASAEEGERILRILSDFVIEDVEMLMSVGVPKSEPGLYGR